MKNRLTKSDWIKHGLRTLAEEGAGALKVGPMATKLEVSRGSFYWHYCGAGESARPIRSSRKLRLSLTV
jgi:hypothetical protein